MNQPTMVIDWAIAKVSRRAMFSSKARLATKAITKEMEFTAVNLIITVNVHANGLVTCAGQTKKDP